MGVLWVRTIEKGGGQGDRGANHFSTHYLAKCDSPTMTRVAVLNCGLLPVYGSVNPECITASCCKTDARQKKEDPYFWDVEAEWNTITTSGRNPTDEQLQPDARRPKWSSRFVAVPTARFADYNGVALADKAGTPFDPAPDIPIYCQEITVRRYEASVNLTTQRGFMGKSNSDAWLSAVAGEALCDQITDGDEEFIQGAYWIPVTYVILIKPRYSVTLPVKSRVQVLGGWDPDYILNAGPLRKIYDSTGKYRIDAVKHGGCYDGRPALLYGDQESGSTHKAGEQIDINETSGVLDDDPYFLQFCTHQRVAFSGLSLSPPSGWSY